MRITITIQADNAAFEENPDEVSDILRGIAARFRDGETPEGLTLRDSNGNTVGKVEVWDE